MRRILSSGSPAILMLVLVLMPQIADGQTRALNDEDARKVASLLMIEARQSSIRTTFNREFDVAINAVHADAKAVIAGKRDAFEIVKGYRSSLVAPPNGEYSATCSRYLTEITQVVAPWAVFGFGLPADELGTRALRGDSAAVVGIVQQRLSVAPRSTEASRRIDKVMDSVDEFYRARGYVPPPKLDYRLFGWYLVAPGVILQMYPVNPYHAVPECAALGNGPVLLAVASPENRAETALEAAYDARDMFANALDRIGWTREQYHDLRAVVVLAHDDAHATEPMEAAAGGDQMLLEYLKESFAQRKKNAAVYRRHAVLLDPLIAATRIQIP